MKAFLITLLYLTNLSFATSALAQPSTQSKPEIYLQEKWATANYLLSGEQKKQAFKDLVAELGSYVDKHSNNAPVLIWSGIIKSTYAGEAGGLEALGHAKAAKADLEAALALDNQALNGSAYTSLGTLYFNVPGWPLAFGNKKKAESYLKTALKINPSGIDSNYFYAEYLRAEGNYQGAEQFYLKALAAPDREGREVADKGRRNEIDAALAETRQHR